MDHLKTEIIKHEFPNIANSKHSSISCSIKKNTIVDSDSDKSRYFIEKAKPISTSKSSKNFNELLQRNLQVAKERNQKEKLQIYPIKEEDNINNELQTDKLRDQTRRITRKKKFTNWLDEQEKNEYKKPLEVIEDCHPITKKSSKIRKSNPSGQKKAGRFNGISEEEIMKKLLPDHLAYGLDILIIGINPGLKAAHVGHHYAGPGNHFWKCMFLSGLTPTQMTAYDDFKLIDLGIGFTNIVDRTTKSFADLKKCEVQEGAEKLKEKVSKYKPKIAVFNGKGIYEIFSGSKKIHLGKQPEHFPNCPETDIFVMPSSSARFAQLPRAIDKLPYYKALKLFRDKLKGDLTDVADDEITFTDPLPSIHKSNRRNDAKR